MRASAEAAQGPADALFEDFQVGRALAGVGVLLHPKRRPAPFGSAVFDHESAADLSARLARRSSSNKSSGIGPVDSAIRASIRGPVESVV